MKTKNAAAVALGRLAKGVPKTLSEEQRERLAQNMRAMHQRKALERAQAQGTPPPEKPVDSILSVSVNSSQDENEEQQQAQQEPAGQ